MFIISDPADEGGKLEALVSYSRPGTVLVTVYEFEDDDGGLSAGSGMWITPSKLRELADWAEREVH